MSTSLIKGGVILIKILKKGILAVVMTALILTLSPLTAFSQEYKPRLTAPNGEPYYTSKLNVYSQTGYGMPNCVAYAYVVMKMTSKTTSHKTDVGGVRVNIGSAEALRAEYRDLVAKLDERGLLDGLEGVIIQEMVKVSSV